MLRSSARLSQSGIPNIVIELNDQEFDSAEGDIIQAFINALESKKYSLGLALNTNVFMEGEKDNVVRIPLKEFLDKYPDVETQPRNTKELVLSFHVVDNKQAQAQNVESNPQVDNGGYYAQFEQESTPAPEPSAPPPSIEQQSGQAKSGLENFMREK